MRTPRRSSASEDSGSRAQIGWRSPLISAAVWNVLACHLMSRLSWNVERIRGGFDRDTELFLYSILPEKLFPIQGGMCRYVRHAHYAEGIWMAIGAAFLAEER